MSKPGSKSSEKHDKDNSPSVLELMDAIIKGTRQVFSVQYGVQVESGPPYVKTATCSIPSDITGEIKMRSNFFNGSLAISYPEATFLNIVGRMFGSQVTTMDDAIEDTASESINMIFGHVKILLNHNSNCNMKKALPRLLHKSSMDSPQPTDSTVFVLPFSSPVGDFTIQWQISSEIKRSNPMFPANAKILIVDDMVSTRKLVKAALQNSGYSDITEAQDGSDAWNKLEKSGKPFDLIVSDWNMPIMQGIDLLKKVRSSSRFRDLPFILLTVEGEREQIVDAISLGVDDYILKPFTQESLKSKLNNVAKKRAKAV